MGDNFFKIVTRQPELPDRVASQQMKTQGPVKNLYVANIAGAILTLKNYFLFT